ncbi:MAG: ABC transporter ATP-binding protein [Oscillospiraceae bacterium]|nr:ABC transporter ATP-binding protein [Oscillospiraceae bacterium]
MRKLKFVRYPEGNKIKGDHSMNTEIVISHLCQSYGRKEVLADVSFTIPQGMFGLLGRNGAGKTTLMKTLATLLAPKGGSVTVCGVPVSQSLRVREMTGYLPQEFSMYPSMTVYEALDYLSVLSGMPKQLRQKRIPELLLKVNLSDRGGTKVKALSGGMKRRLGIAQALLHDPQVIIADEPTAGLDPEERVRFRELFRELAREKTVLLSTHIVSDIEESCENLAILDQGKLRYAGSSKGLLDQTGTQSMEQAYLACIHGTKEM